MTFPRPHLARSSPCINVCILDEAAHLCIGCGRTIGEIAGWSRMTALERHRITAQLPNRLGRPSGPPPGT